MSNITLNTLVYVGEGLQAGVTHFMNRSTALLSGFSALIGRVVNRGKRVETRWNLTIPVLVEDDSPCGCAGEVRFITYVEISVKFDQKASAAHRDDTYVRIQDLIASSQFADSVKLLKPPV